VLSGLGLALLHGHFVSSFCLDPSNSSADVTALSENGAYADLEVVCGKKALLTRIIAILTHIAAQFRAKPRFLERDFPDFVCN
jgi:hypothetical protein